MKNKRKILFVLCEEILGGEKNMKRWIEKMQHGNGNLLEMVKCQHQMWIQHRQSFLQFAENQMGLLNDDLQLSQAEAGRPSQDENLQLSQAQSQHILPAAPLAAPDPSSPNYFPIPNSDSAAAPKPKPPQPSSPADVEMTVAQEKQIDEPSAPNPCPPSEDEEEEGLFSGSDDGY